VVQTNDIQSTRFNFWGGSTADNLVAISGGQSTALGLTASVNRVTSGGVGYSVALPPVVGAAGAWNLKGCTVRVINATTTDLLVYPANGSGDTINGQSSTTPITIPAGSIATFDGATGYPTSITGNWYSSYSPGAGGPLDGASVVVVAAAASNSQSGATAVTPGNIVVGTVSATSRAIRLSAAGTNKSYIVFNDTATAVKVYPVTNGTISSSSTNTAVQIAAHKGEIFLYRNGTHVVVLGATGV
jgi:hypothetical protein